MENNQYISKREYNYLLILAFSLMFLFLSLFICEAVISYNDYVKEHHNKLKKLANQEPIIQFSGGGNINQIAGLHFLTLFIFLSLNKTKRFFIFSSLSKISKVLISSTVRFLKTFEYSEVFTTAFVRNAFSSKSDNF